jgi:hypothetical protein
MSGIIGVGLMVVAVLPNIFELVASTIGLELKARAILVSANLTLFIIVTYLFNRISHLYNKISGLNEELSLLRTTVSELEDNQKKNNSSKSDDD